MSKRSPTAIHTRGLLVVAMATALELLAASNIHAQGENIRNFEARYLGAQAPGVAITQPRLGPLSCEDLDSGTGDEGCGSATGGPSGGNSSRN